MARVENVTTEGSVRYVAYQRALAVLRNRYPDEFDRIYAKEMRRVGVTLRDPSQEREARVQRLFKYIVKFDFKHGHAPTLGQMADEMGLSLGTIVSYVEQLHDEGYLNRNGSGQRVTLRANEP